MITKLKIPKLKKSNVTTKLGSFGTIKLLFRYNEYANKWVLGAELANGTPIFYGQTLIPNLNLFLPWKNLNVPKGRLSIINEIATAEYVLPDFDNIENFTLYYYEDI